MHVMSDSKDPYFTTLQAGAYYKVKPQGIPCDDAYPQGCIPPGLSQGGKIAIGVVITVVGLAIIGLTAYYIYLVETRKKRALVV
jgi:endoglucanase